MFFETVFQEIFENQYFTRYTVATCFKCGGIFNGHLIANLLLILAVRKF